MKNVSNTNYGRILQELGYDLCVWAKDTRGNTRRYKTCPVSGSGAVGYFDSLSEVRGYIDQIRVNRAMEELSGEEWSDFNYSRIMSKMRRL